jgi:AmmeMemoRadiSam system protein B
MYSGPTAAAAYRAVRTGRYEVIVLVGPSHYVEFAGVAAWPDGAFLTPLGDLCISDADVRQLIEEDRIVSTRLDAHEREHSLEMQLPFLARIFPATPVVPLVMGDQTRRTVDRLAAALVAVFRGRDVLLVASSDLSHFFDAATAETLDATVARHVAGFDPNGLMNELERYPEWDRGRYVMCGGGAAVAVMHAARGLDASSAAVIARSHSGQVSGDNDRVVGYMAAAFGDELFDDSPERG